MGSFFVKEYGPPKQKGGLLLLEGSICPGGSNLLTQKGLTKLFWYYIFRPPEPNCGCPFLLWQANETPEERAGRLQSNRSNSQWQRANKTPEQRAGKFQSMRSRQRANETSQEIVASWIFMSFFIALLLKLICLFKFEMIEDAENLCLQSIPMAAATAI